MLKNLPIMQEAQVQSLGQADPLKKGLATHSSILDCRIAWTEEPGDYSPWGRKESDTTEQLFSAYRNCGGPTGPHQSKVCGIVSSQDLRLQGFKEIQVFYLMSLQDIFSTNRYDTPFFITIHFIAFLKLRKNCLTAGYLIFAWNDGVCITEGAGRSFTLSLWFLVADSSSSC